MALSDSLIAWWTLNEESGTRVDSVGSNDLTDTNTVLYGTGKVSNAADFEYDNDESLISADTADLSVGDIDFSWSLWVTLETNAGRRSFLGKLDAAGNNTALEYMLDYYQPDDRFRFRVGDGTDVGAVEANNLGSPSTATWYFIVCWHDATANTINISVNNGTADSAAWTTGSQNTAHGFALGRLGEYDADYHHDGLMDEVGFWKKVLSAAEIKRLYNGGDGVTYPFSWETLAGPFVATGTATKKTSVSKAGPLVLTGTAVKKAKRALAGPIAFAGTLVGKAKKVLAGVLTLTGVLAKFKLWIFFARFRDYFLTAPQRFAISSNKVQMTARYRDYYLTAPEKK